MGIMQDVIDYLKTVKGVIDAHEIGGALSYDLMYVERSVKTRNGSGYKNVGYDEAMKRKHRVCIFYDDTYIFGKRSILKLMSSDGTIMGTNLMPDEIEEYRKKDNVIFVSEDFVVFTDIVGHGEESFVLLPFPIEEIEQNVPGTKNVIGTSPTMTSDMELKKKFRKPMVKGMYTMIVGFDG